MLRVAPALVALAILLTAAQALADELFNVADDDLIAELAARRDDVSRTSVRIEALRLDREAAVQRLEDARMESLEAERRLAANAGLLYRLSHHGTSVKYILSSESPTALLKRLHNLRRLVISGLEVRRDCGVRLMKAEADLDLIEDEIDSAREMLERLEETIRELNRERDRRDQSTLTALAP